MSTEAPKPPFRWRGFSRPTSAPVPNDIIDVIAPELTEAELRVLLYIVRRTFGFGKESDIIPLAEMMHGVTTADGRVVNRGTGLSRQGVHNGVSGLLAKGIITVADAPEAGARDASRYSLSYATVATAAEPVTVTDAPAVADAADDVPSLPALKEKARALLQTDAAATDALFAGHPAAKIAEKLALLEWKLQQRTRGRPITDRPAWLARALAQDTPLPPAAQAAMPPSAPPPATEPAASPPPAPMPPPSLPASAYQPSAEETALWTEIVREIELATTRATYQKWIAPTSILSFGSERLVIQVPDEATKEWLTGRMAGIIRRALHNVVGFDDMELEFVVAAPP